MATRLTPICIADGPTLTAASPASCVPVLCHIEPLPRGYWTPGKEWHLYLAGKISSTNLDARGTLNASPGTARFDLRLGGQVVWDSGAVPLNSSGVFTDVPWTLRVDLVCRSIGSAATLLGEGRFCCADIDGASTSPPKAGGVAVVPWSAAPAVGASFNSFTWLDVDVFFTQTVSTGSLTVVQYVIDEL